MTSTSSLPDETVEKVTEMELAALCAKLRREKVTRMYEGDYINPNGPEAADKLEALAGRVAMLTEALEEMLDTFDGQPMPCEAQEDRQERAVWFAVCALRCVNGEAYNCEGGDVEAALAAVRSSVTEFRAALAQTQSEGRGDDARAIKDTDHG